MRILRDLRRGEFDVLIGINLLREGLDLPEVSLVAILDADKEGYLRSATSLIQTMGRCARHLEGRAILYADNMTDSMRQAIGETSRRRAKQEAYNREHHITPQSIIKSVDMQLARIIEADYLHRPGGRPRHRRHQHEAQLVHVVAQLETQMREAAKNFEFERAAALRDRVRALKQRDLGAIFAPAGTESQPAALAEYLRLKRMLAQPLVLATRMEKSRCRRTAARRPSILLEQHCRQSRKDPAPPKSPENPARTCSAGVPPVLGLG